MVLGRIGPMELIVIVVMLFLVFIVFYVIKNKYSRATNPPNVILTGEKYSRQPNGINILKEERTMVQTHTGKTCPYCQFPIKQDSETVLCSSCRVPHHRECWQENGGCTTYGCQG